MSWDSYVTNMEGEGCMYSGFFDHKGNKWAESCNPPMKISPDQVENIVKGIRGSCDMRGTTFYLGEHKFMVLDKTDYSAVMRQMSGDANSKVMACLGVFNTGVCVGFSTAGEKEKCSRLSAEKYSDYLRGLNV